MDTREVLDALLPMSTCVVSNRADWIVAIFWIVAMFWITPVAIRTKWIRVRSRFFVITKKK